MGAGAATHHPLTGAVRAAPPPLGLIIAPVKW